MKEPSLDERISAALTSTSPATSAELLEILIETTAAVENADEASRIARERSVDPRNLDGELLYEQADIKMFWANRMHNSLSSIQALYDEALAREQAADWRSTFDETRAVRDHLSAEFSSRYQNIVTELVDLFGRIFRM